MNKNNRSKHYDFFQGKKDNDPKLERKTIIRRILFVFKILLYVVLAGLTLTGCVQSFVIRNTTQTGQGLEFYNSTQNVSPYTTLYATADAEVSPTTTNSAGQTLVNTENSIANAVVNSHVNYVVVNKSVTSDLEVQAKNHGANYASLGNITSAISLTNTNTTNFNSVNTSIWMDANNNFQTVKTDNQSENTASVFYREAADGTKRYLFFNNEFTSWTNLYDSYSNIYAISQSPDALVRSNALTPTNDANGNPVYVLERPYLLRVTLEQDSNTPAVVKYNRDVVETLWRWTIAKPVFNQIVDVSGNAQTLEQFLEFIANPTNYITDLNNTTIFSGVGLTPTQAAAYNTLLSINQVVIDAGYIATSANTSTLGNQSISTITTNLTSPNQSYRNFGYGESTSEAIVTFDQAWLYGPFYALIIYPFAQVTAAITSAIGQSGWGVVLAIILVVLLSRLAVFFLTYRGIFGTQRMMDLNAKKAKIEAKYSQYDKSNKVMQQRKRQEVSQLYKRAGINQSDTFISILYTTPIFLAVWRTIQSVPQIKANEILGINFATTSYQAVLNQQQYQYIAVILLAVIFQIVSQILPRLLARKRLKERTNAFEQQQLKKSNRTQNIVLIMFLIFTVILQAGVQVYWIIGAIWTIGQHLFVFYIQRTKFYKGWILDHLSKERFVRWRV
ncbi:membrane protein insertase YidC [Mycoplasmopsis agassizii]|uniref:Membrane protein insertase YidC n=1 Tax=Mycoplasmopsis agassizii TaxID=33922 RepID=A0ABX4H4R4_9BACT|nr:membrane protein insertase YidC [Mycoplasmopsis agassizii]PAF54875.1 membrane protein insertase YidC [Mycoplasmopsis agassizii]SMC20023.1 YidC/Oxa1 family membrane protein insertase [Mycoplasmopsis agassizii]